MKYVRWMLGMLLYFCGGLVLLLADRIATKELREEFAKSMREEVHA